MLEKIEYFLAISMGARISCWMKKSRDEKSSDTVPLIVVTVYKLNHDLCMHAKYMQASDMQRIVGVCAGGFVQPGGLQTHIPSSSLLSFLHAEGGGGVITIFSFKNGFVFF